jgi:hypothetical protein
MSPESVVIRVASLWRRVVLTLPEELRTAVNTAPNRRLQFSDPRDGRMYVVMEVVISPETSSDETGAQLPEEGSGLLLQEMGAMIGWDDPEMDVYNHLDPRKKS